jgi:hypothetical protein
LHFTRL